MGLKTFICEHCGKSYEREWRYKHRKRRFCSTLCSCRARAVRRSLVAQERHRKKCPECGKEFSSVSRHCSQKCAGRAKSTVKEKKCISCGEDFKPHEESGKYCSLTCRDKGKRQSKRCLYCASFFEVHRSVLRRGGLAGSFCSKTCSDRYMVAARNPNWKGGKSFEPYPESFNFQLKEAIREGCGRRCVVCGISEGSLAYRLSVHHVDYDKSNCSPENLVALCKVCHGRTDRRRAEWTARLIVTLRA